MVIGGQNIAIGGQFVENFVLSAIIFIIQNFYKLREYLSGMKGR